MREVFTKPVENLEQYRNLVPCLFPEEITQSIDSIRGQKRELSLLLNPFVASKIVSSLDAVKTWQDFHKVVLYDNFVPYLLDKTSNGLTISGAEKIDPNKSYLYISNHRDTILDSVILGYSLLKYGARPIQPIIGSNLTIIDSIKPYFVMCGSIVIDRGLQMRKLFEQSLLLSRYIAEAIGDNYSSVWIAGGAGRSKNGHDEIKSAVIKMIALSKDRAESFASFMAKLNVLPVSISYEFDPSDVLKTYEWTKASEGADYKKGKREDFFSILKSLRKQKGRISIKFCDLIELEPNIDADAFAKNLERVIRANYQLYDVNYFAYDQLHNTNKFADKYDKKSLLKFFFRCNHMSLRFRENILAYYANPVIDKLELETD